MADDQDSSADGWAWARGRDLESLDDPARPDALPPPTTTTSSSPPGTPPPVLSPVLSPVDRPASSPKIKASKRHPLTKTRAKTAQSASDEIFCLPRWNVIGGFDALPALVHAKPLGAVLPLDL